MKLKSFLKIGLPVFAVSSLAISLPLALTSCSDSKSNKENNKVSVDNSSINQTINSLQSVDVNDGGMSKEDDINTTLLNSLGIKNDDVKHINYSLNKSEEEQGSAIQLAKENETNWKIAITLIEGKTWDFTSNDSNNFHVDGNTLSFDAQTPFSKIGISKDIFTDDLISTSLNEIHNLQNSKNYKQELKTNLLKNSNKLIESSFDIEAVNSTSAPGVSSKENNALTHADLTVSIKANAENGFEFVGDNSQNAISKNVKYNYLDLANDNLVDKLASSLANLIWSNNKMIETPQGDSISVGNHKIDLAYSTVNAANTKTIIGKSNGMGTLVYNLSVNFNDLNISNKSFTTDLQTKLIEKVNQKISTSGSAQSLKTNNNIDFLNTYYNDETNALDIQFRSRILNTHENDIRNLIELSKKVNFTNIKSQYSDRFKNLVLEALQINFLDSSVKNGITVSYADNTLTVKLPKNSVIFSDELVKKFSAQTNDDSGEPQVSITNDDGVQTLIIKNLSTSSEEKLFVDVDTTADNVKNLVTEVKALTPSDIDMNQVFSSKDNKTLVLLRGSDLFNKTLETLNLKPEQVSWIQMKDRDSNGKYNFVVTLQAGYNFNQTNLTNGTVENKTVSYGTYVLGHDQLVITDFAS